jgi:transposase
MAKAYSEDLRARVVRAVEGGMSRRAAARQFDVSISFAVKLLLRWRRAGTLKPIRIGGTKPYALAAHCELVRSLVAAQPDITIDELRSRLAAEGIHVGRSSIGRFLIAQQLTVKKKPARGRTGAARRRTGASAVARGSAAA